MNLGFKPITLALKILPAITLAVLTIVIVPGCQGKKPDVVDEMAEVGTTMAREEDVRAVMELLEGMPSWPQLNVVADPATDAQAANDAKRIEEISQQIANYDLQVIREAFESFHQNPISATRCHEALFWLNQYLFDIPSSIRPDSAHAEYLMQGGWIRPTAGSDPIGQERVLWPWKMKENGALRFTIDHTAIEYFGRPYPALEVFDYYREHFGPRFSDSDDGPQDGQ